MATVTGWTIAHYQQLTAAIASGATSIYYADKRVEYRTLTEMLQIKSIMETDLGLNQPRDNGRSYAEHSKGLC